jgi:YcaO-like protein with predicted kinase domain
MTNMNTFDTRIESKAFTRGTHRAAAPAETLSRAGPHLPAMGITRIANITGLDRIGIPVVVVTRPNSRSLSVSQGKGLDLDSAKASAVMESIESHHAEQIDLPLRLGSIRDVRKTLKIIEIEDLQRSAIGVVDDTIELLWVEGRDLMSGEDLWLPFEMVHTNFTVPRPTGAGCFYASSNGLASGNSLVEAMSHAVCELIERDATTLWYLQGEDERERTRLDPATIDDEACLSVLDLLAHAKVDVWLWESTSNLGVACFVRQTGHASRGRLFCL